jgi:hypothetical protein
VQRANLIPLRIQSDLLWLVTSKLVPHARRPNPVELRQSVTANGGVLAHNS